jgi:hypothetical protein
VIFEPIFEALNRGQSRYLVVGGLATVLHGFARLTADVDLLIDLRAEEAHRTLAALVGVGLRPRAPVDALAFADEALRSSWIRDKGMRVFSLWDPLQPMREVDLFVECPLDFDAAYARGEVVQLTQTTVRIAAIEDLVALKRLAGRPQDLMDIEALERIAEKKRG